MMNARALALCLAVALSAGAAEVAPAPGIGDSYEALVAKRGHPASEMTVGSVRMVYYPDVTVRLRDGVVVEVKPVAGYRAPQAAPTGAPTAAAGPPEGWVYGKDPVEQEIEAFEKIVLGRFNAEKFSELEVLSAHIIKEKSLFGDGSWKIFRFHEALDLHGAASEAEWTGREAEVSKWESRFPGSVTARTVHMALLASYARHSRVPGSAPGAKGVAGSLPVARLAQALDLFQSAQRFEEKSPMLWYEGLTVALFQGWPAKDVLADYQEAKGSEPGFWHCDGRVAEFLLPRWHGKDGDWEKLAESEIQRSDGLGVEGYARTAWEMSFFYRDIFTESQAQWAIVKEGYAAMVLKYGGSRTILNQYAVLAVLAGDREAARGAFEAMKGEADASVWEGRNLARSLAWANARP